MKNKTAKPKRPSPKRVLRLPDLDYAKTAVLNTLSSSDSRRSYRFAIDDFVTWYCSEPRLAFPGRGIRRIVAYFASLVLGSYEKASLVQPRQYLLMSALFRLDPYEPAVPFRHITAGHK